MMRRCRWPRRRPKGMTTRNHDGGAPGPSPRRDEDQPERRAGNQVHRWLCVLSLTNPERDHMKTLTTNRRWLYRGGARCFGAMLMVALVAPASVPAQLAPPPQAVVDLLSTADYAILAGSTITNIPTSAVTGNIGLSPAAGSFMVGLGLTESTGTIYAVDATYPTANVAVIAPTRLTAAKGDLTIAYNDAP
ncbi:ice-binding family protein [Candidatus Latescibacterota bacterium]